MRRLAIALLALLAAPAISHAQPGTLTVTTTPLGSMFPGGETTPFGINNNGEVAGGAVDVSRSGPSQAFLWTPSGGYERLPDVPDGAYAIGINDRAQIIGYYPDAVRYRSFVWS